MTVLNEYPDGLNKTKLTEAVKAIHGKEYGLTSAYGNSKCPLTRMVTNGVITKDGHGIFRTTTYQLDTLTTKS